MRKKIFLISVSIAIAGFLFTGIGLLMGGRLSFTYVLGKGFYANQEELYGMEMKQVNEFDTLELDIDGLAADSFDVEIVTGDSYTVTYPVSKTDWVGKTKCTLENGVLKLSVEQGTRQIFVMDFLSFSDNTIKITVPEGVSLETVDASLAAGDMKLEDIQADNLNLSLDYGSVSISNSIFSKSNVVLLCGDLECKQVTAEELKFDLSYGSMEALEMDIKKLDGSMDCGDLELNLLKTVKEYDIDISADYGDLNISGEEKGRQYQSVYGTTDNCIHIVSGYGDVAVNFAD